MDGYSVDNSVNSTALHSKILALDEQIAALEKDRASTLESWAQSVCPFPIGTITKVQGYAFTGAPCRVIAVTGNRGWNGKTHYAPGYTVHVRILKKDGTDSLNTAQWTEVPEARQC